MTKRDFLNNVAQNNITDEVKAFALAELERLDNRNESRSSKQKEKTAKENAPIIAKVGEYLSEHEVCIASEIAELCDINVQKASGVLRGMAERGELVQVEVKIPKKGKVKGYKKPVAVAE